MRLRGSRAGTGFSGTPRDEPPGAGGAGAAGGGQPGAEADALHGSWAATRWHYTSRDSPARTVDVITDLGGSVTLSLSAGTFILAWEIPGIGGQSIGGRWALRGGALEYSWPGVEGTESVGVRLGWHELALSTERSGWDFDGDGEDEPAGFVGVFVRL